MVDLKTVRALVLIAQADEQMVMADAYKEASDAAVVIGEIEISRKWDASSQACLVKANELRKEARKLGYSERYAEAEGGTRTARRKVDDESVDDGGGD